MKKTTLAVMVQDDKIFLWRKKQWMAQWVYNGIGWKLEWEESIEQCMIREAKEEIGVQVLENDLEKVWIMRFYFKDTPHYDTEVHVFMIKKFVWNIIESDEIEPQWFDLWNIPYDKMWEADSIWLPKVLNWESWLLFTWYFDKDNGKLSKFIEGLE